MIRPEQAFILYANCYVNYDGRAKSVLENGNFIIIHKRDGTLLIHGGTLCTPRNYQPPGAVLRLEGNKLISTRKKETIVINLNEIINYDEIDNWSSNKIKISKTETQLRDWIAINIDKVLKTQIKEIHREFTTPVGAIDILAIDFNNIYHIIEVKRGTASLQSVSQLTRYSDYLSLNYLVRDYIASPKISKNALKLLDKHNQTWLQIDHQVSD